jgi:hypothetical protein
LDRPHVRLEPFFERIRQIYDRDLDSVLAPLRTIVLFFLFLLLFYSLLFLRLKYRIISA